MGVINLLPGVHEIFLGRWVFENIERIFEYMPGNPRISPAELIKTDAVVVDVEY